MDTNRIEELLSEINDILEPYRLTVCIVKKPRQYRYSPYLAKKMFGRNNVRERREKMGLTAYQLAVLMGVDRNIVIRMEDERLTHTSVSMQKFADFFGCKIEDLLIQDETDE